MPYNITVDHMSGSEHGFSDSIASPSDQSYSKPRNGRRKKIRDNQNLLANDTIIKEGVWQCRVERMERRIDSAGRSHYYPEEDLADGSDWYFGANLTSSQTPQHPNKGGMQDDKVQDDKVQKDARRSIILYYNYVTKKRGGLVEPGAYIKIKSPLILKFLRENAKFDEEVSRLECCACQSSITQVAEVLIQVAVIGSQQGHLS